MSTPHYFYFQTNPWIVPFLNHSEHHRHSKRTFFYKAYEKIKDLFAAELKHRVNQFAIMGILPSAITRYFNLITQQYSGHVTIWPFVTVQDYIRILDNPTTELLRNCIINGSRRVYPKVNRMTANIIVERALEKNYLKARSAIERPVLLAEVIESDYDNKEDLKLEQDSVISNEAIQEFAATHSAYVRPKNEGTAFDYRVRSFHIPRSTSAFGMSNLNHHFEDKTLDMTESELESS